MMDSDKGYSYLDEQGINSLTIMAPDEIESFEVLEQEDYIILPDPTAGKDATGQEWSMLLLKEPYKEFLIKFEDIVMQGSDLQFDYTLLWCPEDVEVIEDDNHFINYLTSCLANVMRELDAEGLLVRREITE